MKLRSCPLATMSAAAATRAGCCNYLALVGERCLRGFPFWFLGARHLSAAHGRAVHPHHSQLSASTGRAGRHNPAKPICHHGQLTNRPAVLSGLPLYSSSTATTDGRTCPSHRWSMAAVLRTSTAKITAEFPRGNSAPSHLFRAIRAACTVRREPINPRPAIRAHTGGLTPPRCSRQRLSTGSSQNRPDMTCA